MCHYQTDLWRERRRAADERPRDVVSSELDALAEAYRPEKPVARPVLQRVRDTISRIGTRTRGLLGRLKPGRPAADTRLHPHTQ